MSDSDNTGFIDGRTGYLTIRKLGKEVKQFCPYDVRNACGLWCPKCNVHGKTIITCSTKCVDVKPRGKTLHETKKERV